MSPPVWLRVAVLGTLMSTGFLVLLLVLLPPALALAGTNDRGTAEATLREVDGSPKRAAAAEPAARSRAALERANRMRAAGDETHAQLAERVALAWAEVARDVARAAVAEENAGAARLGASDAGITAERERAQLEEAIAQSGRLRAQLDVLERGKKEAPARTSRTAADAGAATGTGTGTAKPPTAKTPTAVVDGGAR